MLSSNVHSIREEISLRSVREDESPRIQWVTGNEIAQRQFSSLAQRRLSVLETI